MKPLFLLLWILVYCGKGIGQPQFSIITGVRTGLPASPYGAFINRSRADEFYFSMVRYGSQFCVGIQVEVPLREPFFVEAGLRHTQGTAFYRAKYTYASGFPNYIPHDMAERMQAIASVLNMGARLGNIIVHSGFSITQPFHVTNEFALMHGFHEEATPPIVGWQMGIGLCPNRFSIRLEAGSMLSRVCRGRYIGDQSLELKHTAPHFSCMVGYRL